jgi:hypothetical protein
MKECKMLGTPAVFSACHEGKWRSIYLYLQTKGEDLYLTFEQGTTGNYFLKIKREHIARVSAFFAAPSNRATVTWKPSIFSWYRLSFSESNQPGALAIRILAFTPLSISGTTVPFAIEKLVQLGHVMQALVDCPHEPV